MEIPSQIPHRDTPRKIFKDSYERFLPILLLKMPSKIPWLFHKLLKSYLCKVHPNLSEISPKDLRLNLKILFKRFLNTFLKFLQEVSSKIFPADPFRILSFGHGISRTMDISSVVYHRISPKSFKTVRRRISPRGIPSTIYGKWVFGRDSSEKIKCSRFL